MTEVVYNNAFQAAGQKWDICVSGSKAIKQSDRTDTIAELFKAIVAQANNVSVDKLTAEHIEATELVKRENGSLEILGAKVSNLNVKFNSPGSILGIETLSDAVDKIATMHLNARSDKVVINEGTIADMPESHSTPRSNSDASQLSNLPSPTVVDTDNEDDDSTTSQAFKPPLLHIEDDNLESSHGLDVFEDDDAFDAFDGFDGFV
ncbi:MAG: hypothetical protein COT84_08150 [Chlamydiae bacterium CG10_big_fil_rev_8_21_14_0_10_35_9]|nr:MAG: hypothetical protein COT84_08150 [Chlamydiae bacterium CG10_big_fil_rev_8_21_14_0_10_35_9]